ncbi:auxin efflux carrier [Russula dissimulans]|nr:auxin efflux carrier [Russula dissimulans]
MRPAFGIFLLLFYPLPAVVDMISTGALVWTSIRPLLRTFLSVAAGFVVTKANLFPTAGARGCAQLVMNIALPCLVFSRVVPAFTTQNVRSLAPLTVLGLIYGIFGMAMAWVIRLVFWVPHRFRYGILAAGGWANYGDIPTAIAMGITAAAPFSGIDDENLAIAYISAFLLVFFVNHPLPNGGFLIVAKDFEGPDVESEDLRENMRLRRRKLMGCATLLLKRLSPLSGHSEKTRDAEAGDDLPEKHAMSSDETKKGDASIISTEHKLPEARLSTTTIVSSDAGIDHKIIDTALSSPTTTVAATKEEVSVLSRVRDFLGELLKPNPIVIVLSIVIALVDPLKALFVPPSPSFQPRFRPTAPDGQPPLAVILDTTTFIGAAGVPIGLMCLGSALATLRVRSGEAFPRGAIAALALAKMVITPVLGVVLTRSFARAGFVDREDKVLQFVCILFSCLPSATTQVYLTQIYSPTGSVEHLSAFLIPQYVLMPFTMTGLIAYTLNHLF